MKPQISRASKSDIYELIHHYGVGKFDDGQLRFFRNCVASASQLYCGFIDGELVCFWGLIPPSLISSVAYLWLYTTEAMKEHQFLFIRHSKLAVEAALKEYPAVVGHVLTENEKAFRWLRWLGAEFQEPQGMAISFIIRRT